MSAAMGHEPTPTNSNVQNLMFVGTGAGGGVFVVCPSEGEMVRGADEAPAGVPVEAPVAVGVWLGNLPQSDAVGAGFGTA